MSWAGEYLSYQTSGSHRKQTPFPFFFRVINPLVCIVGSCHSKEGTAEQQRGQWNNGLGGCGVGRYLDWGGHKWQDLKLIFLDNYFSTLTVLLVAVSSPWCSKGSEQCSEVAESQLPAHPPCLLEQRCTSSTCLQAPSECWGWMCFLNLELSQTSHENTLRKGKKQAMNATHILCLLFPLRNIPEDLFGVSPQVSPFKWHGLQQLSGLNLWLCNFFFIPQIITTKPP